MRFLKPHGLKGTLICVEGIDGSGKTTQLQILYDWLIASKHDVIYTEWNSSELISQTTKLAKKKNILSPRTFSLLHAVDFADRLEQVIIPAMKAGFTVLADRYVFTGFARDIARGVDKDWLKKMYGFAIRPDLALYYDISPEISLKRICANRKPKFYEAGMDLKLSSDSYQSYLLFQDKVNKEYKKLVKEYDEIVQIDATQSIHSKQVKLRELATALLKKKGALL